MAHSSSLKNLRLMNSISSHVGQRCDSGGSAVAGSVGATLVSSAVAGGADTVMILGITNRLIYDIWAKPEIKAKKRFVS